MKESSILPGVAIVALAATLGAVATLFPSRLVYDGWVCYATNKPVYAELFASGTPPTLHITGDYVQLPNHPYPVRADCHMHSAMPMNSPRFDRFTRLIREANGR